MGTVPITVKLTPSKNIKTWRVHLDGFNVDVPRDTLSGERDCDAGSVIFAIWAWSLDGNNASLDFTINQGEHQLLKSSVPIASGEDSDVGSGKVDTV